MNGTLKKGQNQLPVFVLLLFLIQPVMDVASFWLNEWQMSNAPTLILRFAVLGITVLAGFYYSDSRRTYFLTALTLAGLMGLHALGCAFAGYRNIITDLTNFVRVAQLPVTAICLITFMKKNEKCYNAMRYAVYVNLVIIVAVEILAWITGTEPHSYKDGRGILGWFFSANCQSVILTVAAPVAVTLAMQRRGVKSWSFLFTVIMTVATLFLLGTRLAMLGVFVMLIGIGISVLMIDVKQWKKAGFFFVLSAVLFEMITYSPMSDHRQGYETFQTNRQTQINAYIKNAKLKPLDEEGISQEELNKRLKNYRDTLEPIYERYAGDLSGIFGYDKTMEIYEYSYDVRKLTGERNKKLQYAKMVMKDSPEITRFFGVELDRFLVNGVNYDVENDFHGIYYLYGIVGLLALLLFLGYFIYLIIWALIKDFKQYFTLEAAGWGIAFIMCMVHAFFTAGVLRRPNASCYLSGVLAAVYYLVRIKSYPEKTQK